MAGDTSIKERVLARIQDRSAVIGVIGLGYVGLPLAVEFAKAGFHVVGYDVSQRVADLLMRGESHIQDVPASVVGDLVRAGLLEATTDESRLSTADAISIAVPTPLSKTRDPDMSYVIAAAETATRQTHEGTLVVLESTTYPGTTREVLLPSPWRRGGSPSARMSSSPLALSAWTRATRSITPRTRRRWWVESRRRAPSSRRRSTGAASTRSCR